MMSPEMEADLRPSLRRRRLTNSYNKTESLRLPDVTDCYSGKEERLEKSRAIRSGDWDSVFLGVFANHPIKFETPKHGLRRPAGGVGAKYDTRQGGDSDAWSFHGASRPDGSIRIQDTDMVNEAGQALILCPDHFGQIKRYPEFVASGMPKKHARHINQINIEQGNEPRMMRPRPTIAVMDRRSKIWHGSHCIAANPGSPRCHVSSAIQAVF